MLNQVRAFGLNRSEWFTRIGESPTVKLPRVLDIECVGTVVIDPIYTVVAKFPKRYLPEGQ